jgi:NAD(P)-dependent dehydrogenase (short-subunit alcohol dehydrogenase family)
LGRAVSLAFLDEGATVVVTYRKAEELDLLRQQAGVEAARIDGHRLDVTSEAAAREMVSAALARHGPLDAMVNTVGGYAAGRKLWETDPGVLDHMLSLNLFSG